MVKSQTHPLKNHTCR